MSNNALLVVAVHGALLTSLWGVDVPALQLRVSSETVPAGGTAQIKVFAASPQILRTGSFSMAFDPAVFGSVANATVFSAAGDAMALATGSTTLLTVNFSSLSGGIGQLPDLPIFQVSIPVLAGLSVGTQVAITATLGLQGRAVTTAQGTLTVGGVLSLQNVSPGGGSLPAGTTIQVVGTGFSAATEALVDAPISAIRFVSPQELDFTLTEPTEMTGKRVLVRNADGSNVEYFCSLKNASPNEAVFPTFELRTVTAARFDPGHGAARRSYALQNPSLSPVMVTFNSFAGGLVRQTTAIIPACGLYIGGAPGTSVGGDFQDVVASVPLRMLEWYSVFGDYPSSKTELVIPPDHFVVPSTLNVDVPAGASPATQYLQVRVQSETATSKTFGVSVSTTSGGPWLAATPAQGEACNSNFSVCSGALVKVSVSPGTLSPGTYRGTVTIAAQDSSLPPAATAVILNVGATIASLKFSYYKPFASSAAPPTQTVALPSTGVPASFYAAASTADGANWLSVTPSSGTTPATLTVSVNPNGLPGGLYKGAITIMRPGQSTETVAIEFSNDIGTFAFSSSVGGPPPMSQYLFLHVFLCGDTPVPCGAVASASVSTNSGGNWLFAKVQGNFPELMVSVDPAGLAVGTFTGTIALNLAKSTIPFPVVFVVSKPVVSPPPLSGPLAVTPSSLSYVFPANNGEAQAVKVSLGGVPSDFTATATSDAGLTITLQKSVGYLSVTAFARGPGTYRGVVTISAAGQAVRIPVEFVNTSVPGPILGSIVSAASHLQGPISPGEIVAIHGSEIGPGVPDPTQVRVLFDGAPSTVLYGSEWQINAVVPDEIGVKATTQITVEYNGRRTEIWGSAVTSSAPAIFTLDGTGLGPAAVLNQDNSVNGALSPAARDSVIQIFATGLSANSTGPVTATIGGVDAAVLFAGQAPGAVKGLFQINAVVPKTIAPGLAAPIILTIGIAHSQAGATIAVN